MPEVSYSADQQNRIKAAQDKLASAQRAYDSYLASANEAYRIFCDGWWEYLTDCDIIDGKTTAIGNILQGYVGFFTLGLKTQKRWSKPTSCNAAIETGVLTEWTCRRGSGDCKERGTCDAKIRDYNSHLQAVHNTAISLDDSKKVLASAKANLTTVLDAIAKEVASDPNVQANNAAAAAGASSSQNKERAKWILFGLIALAIIGAAIYFGRSVIAKSA